VHANSTHAIAIRENVKVGTVIDLGADGLRVTARAGI
jgi:hypothetical protein